MAKTVTNEEYQSQLQNHFDDLKPEEIITLLKKAQSYLKLYEIEDRNRDYLISGIVETCVERRQITFKQWKAISAFCRDCKKLEDADSNIKPINAETKTDFKSF